MEVLGERDDTSYKRIMANQSPKGNIWSAIPVAPFCMNLNEGSGAAAQKGTKSCNTQGELCPFVRPPVRQ